MAESRKELDRLLVKLGTPLPVQSGENPNGRYVLVETQSNTRFARVLIEASCGHEQVEQAVTAALAVLARGSVSA